MFASKNVVRIAIVLVAFALMVFTYQPAMSQTSMPVSAPTSASLDGKVFSGSLQPKPAPDKPNVAPFVSDQIINFKDGKIFAPVLEKAGYKYCVYTFLGDESKITFKGIGQKSDDPNSAYIWTGVVYPSEDKVTNIVEASLQLVKGKTVLTEYALKGKQLQAEITPK